jgi:hypothetical protein
MARLEEAVTRLKFLHSFGNTVGASNFNGDVQFPALIHIIYIYKL